MKLPVDHRMAEIVDTVRTHGRLVLSAPPGSGKTTRVPPALLRAVSGNILVLEPRRLAARLAARRVAEEMGERPGETVGWQVRFESVAGPKTRLMFVTEGVLTRRLGDLRGVSTVILDEFHERHLQGDLALAMLRRMDLRLVVMSATLDVEDLCARLGGWPAIRAEGQSFPVEVEYAPASGPLATQVAAAVARTAGHTRGHILVFLPGAGEIRRALEACAGVAAAHGLRIAPLHGDLPAAAQDEAVYGKDRRLILATNVAESSVTIEGVTLVIDSGLARVASHDPWSGLPSLRVAPISKASAVQRAGRAGRTGPGRCLRLYPRQDFEMRADFDVPEIQRADLADAVLSLRAMGISEVAALPWLDAPPAASLQAAETLLVTLGAIDGGRGAVDGGRGAVDGKSGAVDGRSGAVDGKLMALRAIDGDLTEIGRKMARHAAHPRLARLLVEAETRGISADGCLAAAVISERDVVAGSRFGGTGALATTARSDVVERVERVHEARRKRFDAAWMPSAGLEPGAVLAVDRTARHLQGSAPRGRSDEDALLRCILAAYPDRVGRRRGREVLLCGGGCAKLAEDSVLREEEFLVAVSVERGVVRLASGIDLDWLLDVALDRITETQEYLWNSDAERVEQVTRMRYEKLVLDETRRPAGPSSEVAEVLFVAARKAGLSAFVDAEEVARFQARTQFVAERFPDSGVIPVMDSHLDETLRSLCAGASSFAEIRSAGFTRALREIFGPAARAALERLAPESIALPRRPRVVVHYENGRPPWIASRLQDFFGVKTPPSIGAGAVPLQLHLLAPNNRPVQITTDLAGFWTRHYPQIRRELCRRYPKHAWPETPG